MFDSNNWPAGGPTWLEGYNQMPDPDHSVQKRPPRGIVVHSGEHADRVAESSIEDGRSISYHFAHSHGLGRIVQLVALNRRAWHAGPEGNGWLGIAVSGPYDQVPRSEAERLNFRECVLACIEAFGGYLRWWCRHSEITRGKLDPGPGFLDEWMDGTGLTWRKAS